MQFHILSLFPDMFRGFLSDSVLRRGQESGAIHIETEDIRSYATNKHRHVDDAVYGGGAGMLLRPEPISAAIRSAKEKLPNAKVILLAPGGELFTQRKAEQLVREKNDLILIAGRYEGVDFRVRDVLVDEELSIGEYILSGGELAAAVVVDTVARLVPGVLGKTESIATESFSLNLYRQAEFPQFTRPEVWEDIPVPDVLLSGNHAEIERWQMSHIPGLSSAMQRILRVRREFLPYKTKRLFFRNHEYSDIDYWLQWMNNKETTQFLTVSPPMTQEDEEEYYDASQSNLCCLPLTICNRTTKTPIGSVRLDLDPLNDLSASIGIVLGESAFRGKGIGREAISVMFYIGFSELGLERIHLDVFAENKTAIACYEHCGMRQVGKVRKKYLKNTLLQDGYIYEILKEDFFKP
ncbi:tRNA (guanosine(37)-N1)-methyltransferase TrmD [Candidatus Peregrinibacteria bacterium]|nr:MAG: tRNA (guanosine(37)-N1)-methyltransferase TrmD [Candidatus Peregrinibacteria bacterium]